MSSTSLIRGTVFNKAIYQRIEDKYENDKKKEDFNESGALKRDLESTKNGVVLKYSEPPEGALCLDRKWRLYCYKGDDVLNVLYLHRRSFFLIGRDERV